MFATVRNFKNHYSQNPNNASDLPAGVTWLPLDVTDQTAIDKCVVLFKELSGGESLDILVNNAGVGNVSRIQGHLAVTNHYRLLDAITG